MILRSILIALLLTLGATAIAQEDEEETKKTPAMREKVYTVLQEAQTLLEEEEKPEEALQKLSEIERMRDLNTYEKAQMYTFYGYIYFQQENYEAALRAYESVLEQDPPEALATQTLYTLAQLSFVTEDYDGAVRFLERWFARAENPGPQPYILLCQGMYQQGSELSGEAQKKRFREAIEPCKQGIALAKERGVEVRENWYLLLRTFYYELGDYENMLATLETLIRGWPKREYWLQLSGVYGELEQDAKQLAAYEVAYRQGFLTKSSEIVTLAQLLMQAEVPYRAGRILEQGFAAGEVEESERNYNLLAQAWMLAKEDEKAIDPLTKAARLSDSGEINYRLAQTYFNLEQYENAIEAAQRALEKGDLRRRGTVQVLLGMSYFNEKQYQSALRAFREARDDDRSRRMATQWITYVQSEIEREEQLAQALRGRSSG